jgi:hypothetical protein
MDLQLAPVRQHVVTEHIADVRAEVLRKLRALPLREHVSPHMRVAVGVGSRGIGCIAEVVETVVGELKWAGAEPFLVPAMGSHGGGTAEGQRAVLEGYGLSPETLGVPIHSSLETVQIGETAEGMPVFLDVNVADADGIIVINRIKEHTAFKGRWESGLLKMLAVGLGKARGAAEIHNWGVRDAMPAAARVILARMPVLAGVAIVENGQHEAARIEVLPSHQLEDGEAALLELARKFTPKIPFDPIDLLIVQEIGKDISGTGMDLNVIGMWRRTGGSVEPEIRMIAALDLTENSHGNAIGVGYADLITQRLRDKIDLPATYKNCMTAQNFSGAKIPTTLATDREVIMAGLAGTPPARARVVLIRNTLTLDRLWVSEPLLESVAATQTLEAIGPPGPLEFDDAGNLIVPAVD